MDDPPGVLGVDALAAAAEVSVDTVRYYQHLGLLEPPCLLYTSDAADE